MQGGRASHGRGRGSSRGPGRGKGHPGCGANGTARSGGSTGNGVPASENTSASNGVPASENTSASNGGDGGSGGGGNPRDKRQRPASGGASRGTTSSLRGGRGGGGGRRQGGGRSGGGGRGSRGSGGTRADGAGYGGAEALPANKKRRLKLERQQHRPEFDTVSRSKQIWNKLRERKVPPEDRAKLVQELLALIKGKVLAIAMKHDASRVVQTALQFGNREERMMLFSEMEAHIVELSQLAYAHHIVQRLFKDLKGPDELKRLAKAFRGHTVRLATHAIGADVVQTALTSLPTASASLIKSEFYGKEFALFDDGGAPNSLQTVLETRPDRRDVVMKHMHDIIGKLLSKGLMKFQYAHDLLWEYIQEATPVEMQELVPRLLESYLVLLSTRAGSMCAAMCAAHGGAKERKRMMRSLKGYVGASLTHRDSYIAVVRLVESVDDTITCQKSILAELLKPFEVSPASQGVTKAGKGTTAEAWVPRSKTAPQERTAGVGGGNSDSNAPTGMDVDGEEANVDDGEGPNGTHTEEEEEKEAPPALLSVMTHPNGCKLLLRLLAPEHTGYLHPEELEVLKPTLVPAPKSDADDGEGKVNLVPSSRKDASVRRRELLMYLREPLRDVCVSHTGQLMRSKFAGTLVLLEVVRAIGTPGVVKAIAEAACEEPKGEQLPMHEDPAGHLFMKQLLNREAEAQGKAATSVESEDMGGTAWFADALLERAGDGLRAWAGSNRGAFVLSALHQVPSSRAGVAKIFAEPGASAKVVKDAEEDRFMGIKVLAGQLGFGDFGTTPKALAPKAGEGRKTPAKTRGKKGA